ncbi:MAG TPA: MarR family transcriptional regulator [Hyphomonadaceae bacterium]|jgi:Transcriptional regulators|nr:MarR family transcriptional regulator [Hyphomonadaceae bacterium]
MIVDTRDEVDQIVECWRRELPDIDFGPKALVLRVLSTAANLEEIAARACALHGIDLSVYKVLSELRRAGAPYELKPKDLVRCLPISSGGLTSLIDRAERSQLVQRFPDPDDRRGVVVRLTEKGLATIAAAARERSLAEEQALGVLGPKDRAQLEQLLRRLMQQFPQLMPR